MVSPSAGEREWITVLLLWLLVEEICGWWTSLETAFKQVLRGTPKWKDGRIPAKSCTEQGSAVRRSCISYFSCSRVNGDKWTESKRSELQEKTSKKIPVIQDPEIQDLLTEGKRNSANMVEGGVDITKVRAEEWRNVMASWLDWGGGCGGGNQTETVYNVWSNMIKKSLENYITCSTSHVVLK